MRNGLIISKFYLKKNTKTQKVGINSFYKWKKWWQKEKLMPKESKRDKKIKIQENETGSQYPGTCKENWPGHRKRTVSSCPLSFIMNSHINTEGRKISQTKNRKPIKLTFYIQWQGVGKSQLIWFSEIKIVQFSDTRHFVLDKVITKHIYQYGSII